MYSCDLAKLTPLCPLLQAKLLDMEARLQQQAASPSSGDQAGFSGPTAGAGGGGASADASPLRGTQELADMQQQISQHLQQSAQKEQDLLQNLSRSSMNGRTP